MKKIFTLTLIVLTGFTGAYAQGAFNLDKNYVITTCEKVPDGTVVNADAGTKGAEITGEMFDKIKAAYLDAAYNTLPISGGGAEGANYHILTSDYTDTETGITFKAGTYACMNSNNEIKFKDDFFPQGLSNIKQVVFYLASQGQLQTYARQYAGDDADNYIHFEGDPTNRKLKSYKAPGFNTETWTEMNFSKPLKLVVDLTNKQGTADEMTNASLEPNKTADDTELVNMFLQFYEKKIEIVDGKETIKQGDNLIPWTADGKFVVAFKKKAYVMAIALISGTDGAANKYIDIAAENPQWTDTHSSTSTAGISSITTGETKGNGAMYNLAGQRISAPVRGQLYIKDGKKFIKK